MWSLEKSAAVLVLVGLIFIGIGAFVTAQAVIITDDQAKQLGTTMWGSNPGLIESFKEQSRAARNGLYLIVGRTILQIIGTIIPFRRIG
jgi:hypothetical protein